MRFAFITPEFITDFPDGGGLGNYLNRMTKLLVERGHSVELFLPSNLQPQVLTHNGVRVERVRGPWSFRYRLVNRVLCRIPRTTTRRREVWFRARADQLAHAMEDRHQVEPFDVVQSADYLAVGLGVLRKPGRPHVIRCSSPIDLYNKADGRQGPAAALQERLEFEALSRADGVYSPSRFTAVHYGRRLGREFAVVRTPRSLEVELADSLPFRLPERYLIHYGQLTARKGLDWLIEALALAFERDSSLRMVLAGVGNGYEVGAKLRALSAHRDKFVVLYPLPKPQLLRIVRDAHASVLPSLVDNLPNTVIESLTLGVPVIGTQGASIDELVEDGITGRLVPLQDARALSEAILEVWQGNAPFQRGFRWDSAIAREMSDERAVDAFLHFVHQARDANITS